MTTLQPLNVRMPGYWTQTLRNGDVILYPSTARRVIRESSGYVGKRSKIRPLPIHPYSFKHYDWSVKNRSVASDGAESNEGAYGSPSYPGSYFDLSTDQADMNDLWNKALDKLNDKVRGNLDLSIDIAESHQTAKMLRVTDRVQDYTKTAFGRFGPLKAPASVWLAYTYGVRPLCQTIFGLADESVRVVINRLNNNTGRATQDVINPRVVVDTVHGLRTFTTKGTMKCSVTVGVRLYTPDFDLSRWTSLNPVSIAWELMPYSFVVDWFLNVGGYLRNMETYLLQSSKFHSGYRTNLVACNLTISDDRSTPTYLNINTGSCNGVFLDRSLLSGYPIPNLPSFKANLGSSRLISAASLLANFLGRR